MITCRISKQIEFDAGHRVPKHQGKCFSPHGHRYKLVVHCAGAIVAEAEAPDEGMLVDFGILKDFMMGEIHDVLDHGFIVYEKDTSMIKALQEGVGWKIIYFPYIPTAENIARWCFQKLNPLIEHHFRENLKLAFVEVHETPTSIAYYPEVLYLG